MDHKASTLRNYSLPTQAPALNIDFNQASIAQHKSNVSTVSMKKSTSPVKKTDSFIGVPHIDSHSHLEGSVVPHHSGAVQRNQFNPVLKAKSGRDGSGGIHLQTSRRDMMDYGKTDTFR